MAPKFLENIVILCLERCYPKQNSVIHLKSNILSPQNFWAGYASERKGNMKHKRIVTNYVCFCSPTRLTSKMITAEKLSITILNFVGTRIAATNLFQIDLGKPCYLWYCYGKTPPPTLPPFCKGRKAIAHAMTPLSGVPGNRRDTGLFEPLWSICLNGQLMMKLEIMHILQAQVCLRISAYHYTQGCHIKKRNAKLVMLENQKNCQFSDLDWILKCNFGSELDSKNINPFISNKIR